MQLSPPLPPLPPMAIQAISTLAVLVLAILVWSLAQWLLRWRQRKFAGVLPSSDDGSYILVAFDWPVCGSPGPSAGHTGRIPMNGIQSTAELIAGIVEYGREAVDPDVKRSRIDIRYMDAQGVERRLGASSSFADVRMARMIRVTEGPCEETNERGGLLFGQRRPSRSHRKKGEVRRVRTSVLHESVPEGDEGEEDEDDDDITVISNVMPKHDEATA